MSSSWGGSGGTPTFLELHGLPASKTFTMTGLLFNCLVSVRIKRAMVVCFSNQRPKLSRKRIALTVPPTFPDLVLLGHDPLEYDKADNPHKTRSSVTWCVLKLTNEGRLSFTKFSTRVTRVYGHNSVLSVHRSFKRTTEFSFRILMKHNVLNETDISKLIYQIFMVSRCAQMARMQPYHDNVGVGPCTWFCMCNILKRHLKADGIGNFLGIIMFSVFQKHFSAAYRLNRTHAHHQNTVSYRGWA